MKDIRLTIAFISLPIVSFAAACIIYLMVIGIVSLVYSHSLCRDGGPCLSKDDENNWILATAALMVVIGALTAWGGWVVSVLRHHRWPW